MPADGCYAELEVFEGSPSWAMEPELHLDPHAVVAAGREHDPIDSDVLIRLHAGDRLHSGDDRPGVEVPSS